MRSPQTRNRRAKSRFDPPTPVLEPTDAPKEVTIGDKLPHLPISKNVTKRHLGILKEIKGMVETNQKFLGFPIYSDSEKVKISAAQRKEENAHEKQFKQKQMNDLKTFKRGKAGLIKSLKGSGVAGKKKVKDMSLGSDTLAIFSESKQNESVVAQLISKAHEQKDRIGAVGIPMSIIKEELFRTESPNPTKAERRATTELKRRPELVESSSSSIRSLEDEISPLPPTKRRGSLSPGKLSRSPTLRKGDIAGTSHQSKESEFAVIQQTAKPGSPPTLEPVERGEFARRIVTHRMTSTLVIADYANHSHSTHFPTFYQTGQGDASVPQIDYLPRPRDIDNPMARGGAICLNAVAPSPRLDGTMSISGMQQKLKKFSLE